MDKINSDISKNIKKYRKLNGMTQKDLSQKVGVSIAAVSNWETGTNSIDIDSLFKVCDALGVSISEIAACDNDHIVLSVLEKEIIDAYRSAAPLDQALALKVLGIQESSIPGYLLRYFLAFAKGE